jgi:hypothetical protein
MSQPRPAVQPWQHQQPQPPHVQSPSGGSGGGGQWWNHGRNVTVPPPQQPAYNSQSGRRGSQDDTYGGGVGYGGGHGCGVFGGGSGGGGGGSPGGGAWRSAGGGRGANLTNSAKGGAIYSSIDPPSSDEDAPTKSSWRNHNDAGGRAQRRFSQERHLPVSSQPPPSKAFAITKFKKPVFRGKSGAPDPLAEPCTHLGNCTCPNCR